MPTDDKFGDRTRREYLILCGVVTLLGAALMVYAQTRAFSWDEGFHVLAAQMILGGKRPYLDFCFPQTPLNAYWNAGWMRIFGDNWHVVHALATLLTIGAVMLVADFIYVRFPIPRWRLAGAIAAAAMFGLSANVVIFGTIGQAYGIGLFLIVAAFRAAIPAVERRGVGFAALTGLLAGAAAACSLLTAMAGPTFLIWIVLRSRAGNRWIKFAVFSLAGAIPFVPVLWLYTEGPKQVLFNILQYQTMYRHVKWNGAGWQDFEALISWVNSIQAFVLGLLTIAGVLFIVRSSGWSRERRAEFTLCGWLVLAMGAELCLAHPTFERYFLFLVPFMAILAVAGLYVAGSRLYRSESPWVATAVLLLIVVAGIGKALYDDLDSHTWQDMEAIAAKVDQVTPRGAPLMADELIYFLMRRPVPDGMEFAYAHSLDLPLPTAALFHIVSETTLKEKIAAGAFDTAETCDDSDKYEEMKLAEHFQSKAEVKSCTVFWQKTTK